VRRLTPDSNVLISALRFGGKRLQVLELAMDGQIELAMSPAIMAETLRVLRDKFHRNSEQLQGVETLLSAIAKHVSLLNVSTQFRPTVTTTGPQVRTEGSFRHDRVGRQRSVAAWRIPWHPDSEGGAVPGGVRDTQWIGLEVPDFEQRFGYQAALPKGAVRALSLGVIWGQSQDFYRFCLFESVDFTGDC